MTVTKLAKTLAAIAAFALSPILVIFAVPFGCGFTADVLNAAGTPAALAVTAGVSLAALWWSRSRVRGEQPSQRAATAANAAGLSLPPRGGFIAQATPRQGR